MPKSRAAISEALYPIPKEGGLTHPLLWSAMPEELPDLDLDEGEILTWEDLEPPKSPEFDHGKLLAVLKALNAPGHRPSSSQKTASEPLGRVSNESLDNDSEDDLSSSESPDTESYDEEMYSDSEADDIAHRMPSLSELSSSESSSDEDDTQELVIDIEKFKLSLDESTPRVSKIGFPRRPLQVQVSASETVITQ